MTITEFLEHIERGEVPPQSPCIGNYRLSMDEFRARDVCIAHGMYAIVDLEWTAKLADWIGGCSVLEVMAGCGWLAKALTAHGVKITATDDLSWADKHTEWRAVHPVQKIDAIEAITKLGSSHDVLLMSWPPYATNSAYQIIRAWGAAKPIVFIGEDKGGCTADDEFYQHFSVDEYIRIPQWAGIHDKVMIGKYRKDEIR